MKKDLINKIKTGAVIGTSLIALATSGCAHNNKWQRAVVCDSPLMLFADKDYCQDKINSPVIFYRPQPKPSIKITQINQNSPNSQINIYPNANIPKKIIDNSKPEAHVYNVWRDLNHNNVVERNELFGDGKKVFDFDKEIVSASFWNKSYVGPFTIKSWDAKGNLLGENIYNNKKPHVSLGKVAQGYDTGPVDNNFLENIKKAGPGKYSITFHWHGNVIKKEIEFCNK